MLRIMHKSKIQKATITQTKMDYQGSIGIDQSLLEAAEMLPNEKVQVLNLDTGARFETYIIKEPADSGTICLYGPAAHLAKIGQRVFILSYALVEENQLKNWKAKIVYVDQHNKIKKAEENG